MIAAIQFAEILLTALLLIAQWLPPIAVLCIAFIIAGTERVRPGLLIVLGLSTLPLSFYLFSPLMLALAVALVFCGIALTARKTSSKVRVRVLATAIVATFMILAIPQALRVSERLRMRKDYPYVSLRERLRPLNTNLLLVDSDAALEAEIDAPTVSPTAALGGRQRWLQNLHRSVIYQFMQTPELGASRRGYRMRQNHGEEDELAIQLPSYDWPPRSVPAANDVRPERVKDNAPVKIDLAKDLAAYQDGQDMDDRLLRGHKHFSDWFLDHDRYGHVKDVDHVAGFLPHAIVDHGRAATEHDLDGPFNPGGGDAVVSLSLKRLQLVGLLFHETPVVYELDTLPELSSAASAPTRPLNAFEVKGLEALQTGISIYVEQQQGHVRVLGALRNSTQCRSCHAGPAPQLLGAFSYLLKSDIQLDGAPLSSLKQ